LGLILFMIGAILTEGSRPAFEQTLLGLLQRHGASLLQGYRLPTAKDIQHDWARIREEERRPPYRISADFNGDGRRDYAFVLLGGSSHRVRAGALVSKGNTYRAFQLLDIDAGNEYSQRRYVVSVVPPGRYKELEGPHFRLVNPAISVIYTESSESFFIWDAKTSAFRDVAISD